MKVSVHCFVVFSFTRAMVVPRTQLTNIEPCCHLHLWSMQTPFLPLSIHQSYVVVLTSGDMLLYESSKCFHGRPRKFNGSWYTSVFVHYYPKYNWFDEDYATNEKLYAIPPHWTYPPDKMKYEIPLELIGTAFKEPTCPNDWCSTQYSYKWSGPGPDPNSGHWLTPTQELLPFRPNAPCDDIESTDKCASWIQDRHQKYNGENECLRNPGYMLYYCKKSCGVCDDVGMTSIGTEQEQKTENLDRREVVDENIAAEPGVDNKRKEEL